MSYYIMENEEVVPVETEALPLEIEKLYQEIRKKYLIEYHRNDWANDTGDSGMGYDYSNSYKLFREPYRNEIVIHDGKLVGFYVGNFEHGKPVMNRFLKLEQGASAYHSIYSSNRYNDSEFWELNIKEKPAPLDKVCLLSVKEEVKEHNFTPEEFKCKFIESVLDQSWWEDSYGGFNGSFKVIIKLTEEGIENPDSVLQELEKYTPILISK